MAELKLSFNNVNQKTINLQAFTLHDAHRYTMRQSVASNRISQTGGHSNSAATHARLVEKKKEYDAVSALERASALYLERIEALGDDCEVMANAGEGELLV